MEESMAGVGARRGKNHHITATPPIPIMEGGIDLMEHIIIIIIITTTSLFLSQTTPFTQELPRL